VIWDLELFGKIFSWAFMATRARFRLATAAAIFLLLFFFIAAASSRRGSFGGGFATSPNSRLVISDRKNNKNS
jgi:hypothetical protein